MIYNPLGIKNASQVVQAILYDVKIHKQKLFHILIPRFAKGFSIPSLVFLIYSWNFRDRGKIEIELLWEFCTSSNKRKNFVTKENLNIKYFLFQGAIRTIIFVLKKYSIWYRWYRLDLSRETRRFFLQQLLSSKSIFRLHDVRKHGKTVKAGMENRGMECRESGWECGESGWECRESGWECGRWECGECGEWWECR